MDNGQYAFSGNAGPSYDGRSLFYRIWETAEMKRSAQVIRAIMRIMSTRGDIGRKQALFREFRQLGSVYVKFL